MAQPLTLAGGVGFAAAWNFLGKIGLRGVVCLCSLCHMHYKSIIPSIMFDKYLATYFGLAQEKSVLPGLEP